MNPLLKRIWGDPVWSKVIATAVVAAAAGIVSLWGTIVAFFANILPDWVIYLVAGGIVLALCTYIFFWIRNAKRERNTKSILIREDLISRLAGGGTCTMCFMHIDYDPNMLLETVVRKTKESMWEYSMHGLDYGKDWELMSWEHRLIFPRTELRKSLKQLGIKPGFVLEIIPHCTKERLASVPPHPDALINYGSLSA